MTSLLHDRMRSRATRCNALTLMAIAIAIVDAYSRVGCFEFAKLRCASNAIEVGDKLKRSSMSNMLKHYVRVRGPHSEGHDASCMRFFLDLFATALIDHDQI
jgi:hypothetical protein